MHGSRTHAENVAEIEEMGWPTRVLQSFDRSNNLSLPLTKEEEELEDPPPLRDTETFEQAQSTCTAVYVDPEEHANADVKEIVSELEQLLSQDVVEPMEVTALTVRITLITQYTSNTY